MQRAEVRLRKPQPSGCPSQWNGFGDGVWKYGLWGGRYTLVVAGQWCLLQHRLSQFRVQKTERIGHVGGTRAVGQAVWGQNSGCFSAVVARRDHIWKQFGSCFLRQRSWSCSQGLPVSFQMAFITFPQGGRGRGDWSLGRVPYSHTPPRMPLNPSKCGGTT